MNFINNIKRKIIRKIARKLNYESESLRKSKEKPYQSYSGFNRLGSDSFFWGKAHTITGSQNLSIGKNVHIGNNAIIRAEGGVDIGDNTNIDQNLFLSTICKNYNGSSLPFDDKSGYEKVEIGKNVIIEANVCIKPGTKVGDGCIIEMGTTVSGNIEALSIVTSPKCIVVKKRAENHYNYLEQEKRYGGPNGQLYNWGNSSSLINIGDNYLSRRSTSTLIEFNGKKAIKKSFLETPDGSKAFETEKMAYDILKKYKWCPEIYEIAGNSITIEYFNPSNRLDLQQNFSQELLGEILWGLFELFSEGFSHRDFHGRNIFITEEGVKFIDFETIEKLDPNVDFFDSYDITGQGMGSPYFTGNMGVLNKSPISISQLFKISSVEEIKSILNNEFKKRMYNSSITFRTLRGGKERHALQNPKIYSTFNLFHTKIGTEEGQRNTEKRFGKFRIEKKDIKGKRILDIGSNIGATLLNLSRYEPFEMVGLEYDKDKVEISRKLAKYNKIHNVEFQTFDIETDNIDIGQFDVVFCLAVIEHLKNKERLFELLNKTCNGTLYFEGNANSDIEYITNSLKHSGFQSVTYLGLSDDEENVANNNRPLFIAKK